MRTLIYSSLIFVLATLLCACAPRVATHITPSFAGARTLITIDQAAPHVPIQLHRFTSSLKSNFRIPCLKNNAIKSPFLRSFSGSFYYAIRNDLNYAHLYHPYVTSAYLQGNLDKLYFDVGGFGQGYWYIQMTFYGKPDKGQELAPFTISNKHYFSLDNEDPNYCQQIADDFPSAVQQFINNLYNSPQFSKIITAPKN